jgi:putative ABC transport system permease protein
MVTESLAQQLWPGSSAVGRSILIRDKKLEVVGVVKDYRLHTVGDASTPLVLTAYWQNAFQPQIDAYVAIGVAGDPQRSLEEIRRTVAAVDVSVPVTQASSLPEQIRSSFTEVRLGGAVLAVAASLALFLSAIGLYGVVSFIVAQRTREIGVRIAVGARAVDVVVLVVRQAMRPIWAGAAIGLTISFFAAPLLSRWLFGIEPIDGGSIAMATLAVGCVSLLASYLPARRAARTDPALVFRGE